eukprot:Polyplicarium_translucidae@DN3035_c0_g1_i4.p1
MKSCGDAESGEGGFEVEENNRSEWAELLWPRNKKKRSWRIALYAFVFATLVISITVGVMFAVLPSAVQRAVDGTVLQLTSVTVSSPSASSVQIDVAGQVKKKSPLSARIDGFPVVVWHDPKAGGHDGSHGRRLEASRKIGDMRIGHIDSSGKISKLHFTTPLNITDAEAFDDFLVELVQDGSSNWRLSGSTTVHVIGMAFEDVRFDKSIKLNGFGIRSKSQTAGDDDKTAVVAAPENVRVVSYDFSGSTFLQIRMAITVRLLNAGHTIIEPLGDIGFRTIFEGIHLGIISAKNVTLRPGDNEMVFVGGFDPFAEIQNQELTFGEVRNGVAKLLGSMFGGSPATISVIGDFCSIPLYTAAIRAIDIDVPLRRPSADDEEEGLLRGLEFESFSLSEVEGRPNTAHLSGHTFLDLLNPLGDPLLLDTRNVALRGFLEFALPAARSSGREAVGSITALLAADEPTVRPARSLPNSISPRPRTLWTAPHEANQSRGCELFVDQLIRTAESCQGGHCIAGAALSPGLGRAGARRLQAGRIVNAIPHRVRMKIEADVELLAGGKPFERWIASYVREPFVVASLVKTSADAQVNLGPLGLLQLNGLEVDRDMQLAGMDGMNGTRVQSITFGRPASDGALTLSVVRVLLANPGKGRIGLGPMLMEMFYQGMHLGYLRLRGEVEIRPGDNMIVFEGFVDPVQEELPLMDTFFIAFASGTTPPSPVTVKMLAAGTVVRSREWADLAWQVDGRTSTPRWITQALADTELKTHVTGVSKGSLIRETRISDLRLTMGDMVVPISGGLSLTIRNPLGPHNAFVLQSVSAEMELELPGGSRPFALLETGSLELLTQDMASDDTIEVLSQMDGVLRVLSQEAFGEFAASFLSQTALPIHVNGTAVVAVQTSFGLLRLSGVRLTSSIRLDGFGGIHRTTIIAAELRGNRTAAEALNNDGPFTEAGEGSGPWDGIGITVQIRLVNDSPARIPFGPLYLILGVQGAAEWSDIGVVRLPASVLQGGDNILSLKGILVGTQKNRAVLGRLFGEAMAPQDANRVREALRTRAASPLEVEREFGFAVRETASSPPWLLMALAAVELSPVVDGSLSDL